MAGNQYISLLELTGEIQSVVSSSFKNKSYWVLADISDHKYYSQKGYHYFSLVEKNPNNHSVIAKMQAAAWGDGARSIQVFQNITGQSFKNDIRVLVNVSVTYSPSYGLQLILNSIDTSFTIGQLEQQRQATLQRLLDECSDFIWKSGNQYITRNSQLQLKPVIQKIAVVSSMNSAGFKDFQDTLEMNKHKYLISIDTYFTMVQGEANADALFNTLLNVYNSGIIYDAVIIIRGGGSQTDLLIFDQFNVAKIIAKFPIPIIAGIGHQVNETIADLMAHTSVKTPSIAAEFIISHNRQFEEDVLNLQKSIIIKSQQLFNSKQQRLVRLNSLLINKTKDLLQDNKDDLTTIKQGIINSAKSMLYESRVQINNTTSQLFTIPKMMIGNERNNLANEIKNLESYSRKFFVNKRGYIGHYSSVCKLMDPENLLKKGFALLYKNDRIVVDGQEIVSDDKVTIRLHNSEIQAIVTSNKIKNGNES